LWINTGDQPTAPDASSQSGEGQEIRWKALAAARGQTVTLVYRSHFERGTAIEELFWLIRQGRPALAGYHVKSYALAAQ
jgi:predicted secreted protein